MQEVIPSTTLGKEGESVVHGRGKDDKGAQRLLLPDLEREPRKGGRKKLFNHIGKALN